jgi:polyferredoxin
MSLWKNLERAGLALFLVGFGLFLYLATGGYRLSGEGLQSLIDAGKIYGHHAETLGQELQPLVDQEYGSAHAFLGDAERKIDEANERLDAKIWDYDRGQYLYHLAREASLSPVKANTNLWFLLTIGLCSLGGLLYVLPRIPQEPAGIKNNGTTFSKVKSRGWIGIGFGVFLIGFYIALYFFPAYITNWIRLADPVSRALRGWDADRWFFYGFLYTVTVAVMGVRMMVHYRHSRYHLVRTASVIFFQTGFAFLLPGILEALNRPYYDFKNAWPLNYTFFYDYNLNTYTSSAFGWFLLLWGIGLAFLLVPLFAFFFGKRWYCSWVCGCGGLAETLGDPFRHLSDKSLKAWRIERWLVHGVLVFAVGMTAIVLANYLTGKDGGEALFASIQGPVRTWYGFLIGSIFAGVVGTGFYPFMGNRVWCRFGCPLAAILGLVQRFKSRFRITTNGGQCISCGNCSTYCEMGIDVRWYAQRGQNIIRASCVGCGVCAAVCPRGVLRLENGPETDRFNEVSLVQIGQGRIDIA